jgi:hypothetical protein
MAEGSQRAWQEFYDGGDVGEEAHVACAPRGVATQLFVQLTCLMQQGSRANQQCVSGRGELDAARAANQQGGAEVLFQVRDSLADGRGHRVGALRGTRNGAAVRNGNEDFQVT